ncbi:mitogen-activated protein kinase kinase kinase 1-like [Eucalyptus grandis]|uniref:mitogen-activated protein kinase kinase kinase 1-like n=1 Tax=Eucalyptus grandis TaxID=71139 RepID=UPI00192F093E|nr:mitogen-activated protein kinase kinase kinase 1-like [Eucalyptus grandis]
MAATGGSSSASATQYDVFLSFRGPDTRNTFTDYLYRTMVGQGIVAYRDSEELHAGDRIDDLLRAVSNSKICIPVLSRGYASSAWCLRELARVTELHESTGKPEILPIFFDVTPTDVKLRTEMYLKDLEKHEQRHGAEMRQQWEAALGKVAEIKGWEVQGKAQGEVIELVNNILRELKVSFEVDQTSGVDDRSVRRRITSWKKGKLLGKGSFGEVYQALTNDGFFFAVKEVCFLDQGSHGKESLLQEISILSQLQHENIVQYYGTKEDDKKLYIFLELMTEGSLETLYRQYNLSDLQVSAYTKQILNGLKYLHDQHVVHRDIKCANILVDARSCVKLADFGLAKAIKKNDAKSSKGSFRWMAPEVVNPKNKSYGLAADIWSLGCTVLEMLTRQYPYSHLEEAPAVFKIGQGELPPLPPSLSRDAEDFILSCLEVNPNKRPSAAQLLDHAFVRKPPTPGCASPCFNNMFC